MWRLVCLMILSGCAMTGGNQLTDEEQQAIINDYVRGCNEQPAFSDHVSCYSQLMHLYLPDGEAKVYYVSEATDLLIAEKNGEMPQDEARLRFNAVVSNSISLATAQLEQQQRYQQAASQAQLTNTLLGISAGMSLMQQSQPRTRQTFTNCRNTSQGMNCTTY